MKKISNIATNERRKCIADMYIQCSETPPESKIFN